MHARPNEILRYERMQRSLRQADESIAMTIAPRPLNVSSLVFAIPIMPRVDTREIGQVDGSIMDILVVFSIYDLTIVDLAEILIYRAEAFRLFTAVVMVIFNFLKVL